MDEKETEEINEELKKLFSSIKEELKNIVGTDVKFTKDKEDAEKLIEQEMCKYGCNDLTDMVKDEGCDSTDLKSCKKFFDEGYRVISYPLKPDDVSDLAVLNLISKDGNFYKGHLLTYEKINVMDIGFTIKINVMDINPELFQKIMIVYLQTSFHAHLDSIINKDKLKEIGKALEKEGLAPKKPDLKVVRNDGKGLN